MDDGNLSDSDFNALQQPYDDLPDYNTDLNASFTEIEQANQDNWAESVASSYHAPSTASSQGMYGNSFVGPGGNSPENAAASSVASSHNAPSMASSMGSMGRPPSTANQSSASALGTGSNTSYQSVREPSLAGSFQSAREPSVAGSASSYQSIPNSNQGRNSMSGLGPGISGPGSSVSDLGRQSIRQGAGSQVGSQASSQSSFVLVTPGMAHTGFSRPITQQEADDLGLGNAAGYRAILDPNASAQVVAVLPVPGGPPTASNSQGQRDVDDNDSMGSWDRLNDPVNYAGNLHTHPLRRQTVGNMRAGPVRNPPNLHTIPELDEEQKRWKQAQDENRDPLVDWANNYFQKLAQNPRNAHGQGHHGGGGGHNGGGGRKAANTLNVNAKFNNQTNLALQNKITCCKPEEGHPKPGPKPGKKDKATQEDRHYGPYPDLPTGGGGDPPRDVEGVGQQPTSSVSFIEPSALTHSGSADTGSRAPIKPSPARLPIRARVTAQLTRGVKSAKTSLCATLVVSAILLVAVLILRELGWLALHYVPTEDVDALLE